MKQIIYSFIIGVIVVSCQSHYTENETILRAESLLETAPDSSLNLLRTIQSPEEMSAADYAAWCLHYTHAQYKLDYLITSDSLIKISIDYYADGVLPKYSGLAYYELGCIGEMQQDKDKAMQAYKQSEEQLKKTDEYNLLGLVNYNMGYIYYQDEVFDKSLLFYRKAQHYFNRSKNFKNEAYTFIGMTKVISNLSNKQDSLLFFFDKAKQLSLQNGDSSNYYNNLSDFAVILLFKTQEFEKAKKYLLDAYRSKKMNKRYIGNLAYAYAKLNVPDSAQFYFDKSLSDTTNATNSSKSATFLVGAYVAKSQKNFEKAFNYYKLYDQYRDSVVSENKRSELYRIDKRYDLTLKERENTTLKIANRNKVIVIAVLLIVVLFVLVVLLFLRNRQKKQQAEITLERQRMEFEMSTKQIEIEQKRRLLLTKLHNRIENTLRFKRLKIGLSLPDQRDEFIDEIMKQSTLSEKEWQYYIDEVNQIFENSITDLFEKHPELTMSDKIVISLICLRLDISDCCSLLDMSKNTMYHRRRIIKDRIGITRETDLEEWVLRNIAYELTDEEVTILMFKTEMEKNKVKNFLPKI